MLACVVMAVGSLNSKAIPVPCVQVWAVLLTDLLLLTRPDSDDQLIVVDTPVVLHDVVSHDFSRPHRESLQPLHSHLALVLMVLKCPLVSKNHRGKILTVKIPIRPHVTNIPLPCLFVLTKLS